MSETYNSVGELGDGRVDERMELLRQEEQMICEVREDLQDELANLRHHLPSAEIWEGAPGDAHDNVRKVLNSAGASRRRGWYLQVLEGMINRDDEKWSKKSGRELPGRIRRKQMRASERIGMMHADYLKETLISTRIEEIEADLKLHRSECLRRYDFEKEHGLLDASVEDLNNRLHDVSVQDFARLTATQPTDAATFEKDGETAKYFAHVLTCAKIETSVLSHDDKRMLKAVQAEYGGISASMALHLEGCEEYFAELGVSSEEAISSAMASNSGEVREVAMAEGISLETLQGNIGSLESWWRMYGPKIKRVAAVTMGVACAILLGAVMVSCGSTETDQNEDAGKKFTGTGEEFEVLMQALEPGQKIPYADVEHVHTALQSRAHEALSSVGEWQARYFFREMVLYKDAPWMEGNFKAMIDHMRSSMNSEDPDRLSRLLLEELEPYRACGWARDVITESLVSLLKNRGGTSYFDKDNRSKVLIKLANYRDQVYLQPHLSKAIGEHLASLNDTEKAIDYADCIFVYADVPVILKTHIEPYMQLLYQSCSNDSVATSWGWYWARVASIDGRSEIVNGTMDQVMAQMLKSQSVERSLVDLLTDKVKDYPGVHRSFITEVPRIANSQEGARVVIDYFLHGKRDEYHQKILDNQDSDHLPIDVKTKEMLQREIDTHKETLIRNAFHTLVTAGSLPVLEYIIPASPIDSSWANVDAALQSHPWYKQILASAAKREPYQAVVHYYQIASALEGSDDREITLIKTIAGSDYGMAALKNVALLFYNRGSLDEVGIQAAMRGAANHEMFFRALLEIDKKKEDVQDRDAVRENLTTSALRLVADINALHNESDEAVRFASVDGFTAEELYLLATWGEKEMTYRSTFGGIFKRALERMEGSGEALMDSVNCYKFRTWMRLCVNAGVHDEFLAKFSDEGARTAFLNKLAAGLDNEQNPIQEGWVLYDIMKGIEASGTHIDLGILKRVFEEEFKRLQNNKQGESLKGAAVYHVLLQSAEADFKKQLEASRRTPAEHLFHKGINVQCHLVYDDRVEGGRGNEEKDWDGHHNFRSTLETYGFTGVSWDRSGNVRSVGERGNERWHLSDKGSFIVISSLTEFPNGKEMVIVMNKPDSVAEGRKAMAEFLAARNLEQAVEIVKGRGHSFHGGKTKDFIANELSGRMPAVIDLGSCWGHTDVLELCTARLRCDFAPISCKGTGKRAINEAITKVVTKWVQNKRVLDWVKIKEEVAMSPGVQENLSAWGLYVFPHENTAMVFAIACLEQMQTMEKKR